MDEAKTLSKAITKKTNNDFNELRKELSPLLSRDKDKPNYANIVNTRIYHFEDALGEAQSNQKDVFKAFEKIYSKQRETLSIDGREKVLLLLRDFFDEAIPLLEKAQQEHFSQQTFTDFKSASNRFLANLEKAVNNGECFKDKSDKNAILNKIEKKRKTINRLDDGFTTFNSKKAQEHTQAVKEVKVLLKGILEDKAAQQSLNSRVLEKMANSWFFWAVFSLVPGFAIDLVDMPFAASRRSQMEQSIQRMKAILNELQQ